jgi:hypothetical protein
MNFLPLKNNLKAQALELDRQALTPDSTWDIRSFLPLLYFRRLAVRTKYENSC